MSLLQPAIDLLVLSACREGTDKYTPAVAILKATEQRKRMVSRADLDEWVDFLWHAQIRKDPGLLRRRLHYILTKLGHEMEEES